ncbi:hypothetical protein HY485_04135, partial [Candidatus Woesearchaeota archaeon]|nr:hypothetical protein [Candidatus Woesearchaeota archaeon]
TTTTTTTSINTRSNAEISDLPENLLSEYRKVETTNNNIVFITPDNKVYDEKGAQIGVINKNRIQIGTENLGITTNNPATIEELPKNMPTEYEQVTGLDDKKYFIKKDVADVYDAQGQKIGTYNNNQITITTQSTTPAPTATTTATTSPVIKMAKVEELSKKTNELNTNINKLKEEIEFLTKKGTARDARDDEDLQKKQAELQKKQTEYAEVVAALRAKQFEAENLLKNGITIMRGLMNAYDQYSGIARFGSLFLTGDNWQEWRNTVNQAFCDTIILGGKQCWISKVCDQYIDATPAGNSLIARTPGGAKGVVHLEAERSLPIEVPQEGTQYIYKLTYTITNPNNKPMQYNLRFHTKDTTYAAFQPSKELIAGGTDGKIGSQAFYKQSKKDYTQVCLVWSPSIETFSGRSVSEFCQPITHYEGKATNPYTNLPTQPGTCTDGLHNQGETSTDCGGPCPQCGTPQKPKEFDGF